MYKKILIAAAKFLVGCILAYYFIVGLLLLGGAQ